MQCDCCVHCVQETIRVDYGIGGMYCDDCALDYDTWTEEEIEAANNGECPYFKIGGSQ